MSLVIPPAVNYQSPLVAIPSRMRLNPTEGDKAIPFEIDWVTMGGSQNCVAINLQNNATLNFSQIVSMKIDNSECGADVQVTFTDTQDTLIVRAYDSVLAPVTTGQTQFFIQALGTVEVGDFTKGQILNFLPPPVVLPATLLQESTTAHIIGLAATGTTQLIAAPQAGTISGLNVNFSVGTAANTALVLEVQDGNNAILWAGVIQTGAIAQLAGMLIDQTNLNLRFANGLKFVITGVVAVTGSVSVNVFYRTP